MKQMNEKTLSRLMKLSVTLFLQCSFTATASEYVPHNLQTGRVGFTNAQLLAQLGKLSPIDKDTLAILQLKKLVPKALFKNIPFKVLDKVNFSCADDEWDRAGKFIKLALSIEGLDGIENKDSLIALAYEEAGSSLESTAVISNVRKWDYYLSFAQFKSWTAHNLFKCGQYEKGLDLLMQAWNLIGQAEDSLHYIRSVELEPFKNFINGIIENVSEDDLKKMAEDMETELRFSNRDDLDSAIRAVANSKAKTQEKHLESKNYPENIKKMALKIYTATQVEKLSEEMVNSLEKKRHIIKQQNSLLNYYKLVELGYMPHEIRTQIEEGGYLDYAEFLSNYSYLGNSEEGIKNRIRHTIATEREKIESIRSQFSKALELFDSM